MSLVTDMKEMQIQEQRRMDEEHQALSRRMHETLVSEQPTIVTTEAQVLQEEVPAPDPVVIVEVKEPVVETPVSFLYPLVDAVNVTVESDPLPQTEEVPVEETKTSKRK